MQFERPIALLLLALLVPVLVLAWRSRRSEERWKWWTSLVLRSLVVLLLVGSLAQPSLVRRGEAITTAFVLDRSRSIPMELLSSSRDYARALVDAKEKTEDRVAVVTVGREAEIASQPDTASIVPTQEHSGDRDASNLAAGVRQALSILPPDTAKRIVLVSDGNENVGSLLAEAEVARSNGIPIDVVPIEYEAPNEVVFEALRAPTRARPGQTADLRLMLNSQRAASGTVFLRENGNPIDLDPSAPGDGLAVDLDAGPRTIPVPFPLEGAGTRRFEAVFEPADASQDRMGENNRATAVTFIDGSGEILIVDPSPGFVESDGIADILERVNLDVVRATPADLSRGGSFLSGFDAIVMVNTPRWLIDGEVDRLLRAYVHDLGGGLMVVGGDQSFGAGGWIDSELSQVLPVKLDPPATRQMVRGGLALIVHSCEMPQGNYWAQMVSIAAIEALTRLDLIGIITHVNGAEWAHPLQEAGDKTRAIAAARAMVVGDMFDFEQAVAMAVKSLEESRAGQRHVIIISDGDPAPPSDATMKRAIASKVTITTVMVSGHGTPQDYANMRYTAETTGGKFYEVTNPKELPKIFTKEASIVSRSLLVEGEFQPSISPSTTGPLRGISAIPALAGYVLTIPRDGLSQVPVANQTAEGVDPVYAYWNHGLGRAIAFTSDGGVRWTKAWASWGEYRSFWEQSVRWLLRPPVPTNAQVRSRVEGEVAIVDLEAIDEKGGFASQLDPSAMMVDPEGRARPLAVAQIGPGRWRAEFPVTQAGSYLVSFGLGRGQGEDTRRATIQASVSVPYPKEFRTVRDNRALLEQVAEKTGGRVLRLGNAQGVDAFLRDNLPIPESARRMWDLMAIIAAILFLLDVAARRVAIDWQGARADVAGRIAVRRAGEGSLEAWKKARAQGAARAPVADAAAQARMRETLERGPALDVRREAAEGGSTQAAPGATQGSAPAEGGAASEAEKDIDTTSRLLRAKRRARGDGDGGGAQA
ncbi:MAG: VWA domain-containing protein [Planctomycetota bacterium]